MNKRTMRKIYNGTLQKELQRQVNNGALVLTDELPSYQEFALVVNRIDRKIEEWKTKQEETPEEIETLKCVVDNASYFIENSKKIVERAKKGREIKREEVDAIMCCCRELVERNKQIERVLTTLSQNKRKLKIKSSVEHIRFDKKVEYISMRNETITIVTRPIVINYREPGKVRNYEFGRFAIKIKRKSIEKGNFDRIKTIALEPNWPKRSRDYNNQIPHPHIHNGVICTGEAGASITEALKRGDIVSISDILYSLLTTYNPVSPHLKIEQFRTKPGVDMCNVCGNEIQANHSIPCLECIAYNNGSEVICINCSEKCKSENGFYYCLSHIKKFNHAIYPFVTSRRITSNSVHAKGNNYLIPNNLLMATKTKELMEYDILPRHIANKLYALIKTETWKNALEFCKEEIEKHDKNAKAFEKEWKLEMAREVTRETEIAEALNIPRNMAKLPIENIEEINKRLNGELANTSVEDYDNEPEDDDPF